MDSSGEGDENFLDSDEIQIMGGADNQQIDFLKTTLELEKGLKGLELEDANFMISDLLNQMEDDDCEEGSEDPCLEYYDEDGTQQVVRTGNYASAGVNMGPVAANLSGYSSSMQSEQRTIQQMMMDLHTFGSDENTSLHALEMSGDNKIKMKSSKSTQEF